MAVVDPLIDTLFDGRYRIVRKIGAGGMANVYLAEDQELGRRVAIKILNDRHANDDQFVERFRREAKNAASISHPNIVSIYDRGEAEGTYYIAMEFLDGRSLKELIVSRGPAPANVAIEYARQILSALRFAHRHGIVHRDIKPHNVLVDRDGRVKVTDFGIARAGASQMTEAGSIVGTAQYLSPEQARGANVDPRSDLYSLGVVLYELLTGESPFDGDTPVEIAMKHLSQTPAPPSSRRRDVPRELDQIVTRALAKNPEDRYQSAEEMDADLERASRGVAVSPETEEQATRIIRGTALPAAAAATSATMIAPRRAPPPPPRQAPYYDVEEPIHRRPIWPWIAALVFVAAAGIGGWYVYRQISNKISSNAPVAVGYYVNDHQAKAEHDIRAIGLVPKVVKQPSAEQPQPGLVFKQDPTEGERIAKESTVTIWVSTGKPRVPVPGVVGEQSTDAVSALKDAKLVPDVHQVPSGKPQGEVTAQDPKEGTSLVEGSTVRINVSKGPQPIAVPGVVGESLAAATQDLNARGFAVNPHYVDDLSPKDTVIDQDPAVGGTGAKGSTVDLTVSKGPKTAPVPDVTSQDVGSATQQLQDAGFKAKIVYEETADPTQVNIVLSQDPVGQTQAKPGATVTVSVGRLASTTAAETTTTVDTTTVDTTTVDTTTTDTTTIPTP